MQDSEAVSPVVGTLLILAVFATVTATVIFVAQPQLEEYRDKGTFDVVQTQLGQVAADVRQLAVSGNEGEVRKPTITLGGGSLHVDQGHWFAASVGYFHENFSQATGMSAAPGHHFGFTVQCDPASAVDQCPDIHARDTSIEIVFYDLDAVNLATSVDVEYRAWQWVKGDWVARTTTTAQDQTNGDETAVALDSVNGGRVVDGPWRIEVHAIPPLPGPDVHIGDVFLFNHARFVYEMDTRSGPRSLHSEAGSLFRMEHGRIIEVEQGVMAAPDVSLGNSVFTLRTAFINATAVAGEGQNKMPILLSLADQQTFVDRGGASIVRVQLWGEQSDPWYNHLENRGFTKETVDAEPTAYFRTLDDTGDVIPHNFHFIWSKINALGLPS